MSFEVGLSREGRVAVLAPAGRLDTRTVPQLEEAIQRLLGEGERRIVLDLAALEYLSSAGLRVLLVAGKRLGGGDGYLALCGLNATVREVFDIAGFTPLFTIFATRAAAVAGAPSPDAPRPGDALLEAAARQLGASGGPAAAPREETGDDLVARAARALGVGGGATGPGGRWVRT